MNRIFKFAEFESLSFFITIIHLGSLKSSTNVPKNSQIQYTKNLSFILLVVNCQGFEKMSNKIVPKMLPQIVLLIATSWFLFKRDEKPQKDFWRIRMENFVFGNTLERFKIQTITWQSIFRFTAWIVIMKRGVKRRRQ